MRKSLRKNNKDESRKLIKIYGGLPKFSYFA